MSELDLIEKIFHLKRLDIFLHLDIGALLPIAKKVGVATFDEKSSIFHREDEANHMFFIIEGEVEVASGDEAPKACVGKNQFFGEESFFNGRLREYDVVAIKKTTCLTLTRSNIYAIISEFPSVGIALLEQYAGLFGCRLSC